MEASPRTPLSQIVRYLLISMGTCAITIIILGLRVHSVSEAHASVNKTIHRVQVLEFRNLTGSYNDTLVSGFTEELKGQLSELQVPTSSVSESLCTMEVTPSRQREEYLVKGSIRKEADTLRITAELVRSKDDALIWSRSYSGSSLTAIASQENIALAVAGEVRKALGTEDGL